MRCNCVGRPPAHGGQSPLGKGPPSGHTRRPNGMGRGPSWELPANFALRSLLDSAPARHGGGPDPAHALAYDFAIGGTRLRSRHAEEADGKAEQDGGEHDINEAHGIFPSLEFSAQAAKAALTTSVWGTHDYRAVPRGTGWPREDEASQVPRATGHRDPSKEPHRHIPPSHFVR